MIRQQITLYCRKCFCNIDLKNLIILTQSIVKITHHCHIQYFYSVSKLQYIVENISDHTNSIAHCTAVSSKQMLSNAVHSAQSANCTAAGSYAVDLRISCKVFSERTHTHPRYMMKFI